jgi:hypothetical protein
MGAYTQMEFATSSPAADAAAVLRAYDFSAATSLADIGGGEGPLLPALLRTHPALQALVLDLESVLGSGVDLCDDANQAGEFFAGIPAGCDLYLLNAVLSHWSDRIATCILRNCRAAMGSHSRLLVIERLEVSSPPSPAATTMRTAPAYRALLHAAGLTCTRIVPTAATPSIIEAMERAA